MKPEIISTESIYKGKIFDVSLDRIREGETEYSREIVTHNGSAVIVPIFADKTIAMVRQYRHAAGKYLLEIPAGTLNKDELPEIGAARELREEIGLIAEKIEKLTEFYVSPGFLTEKMYVFLATDFTKAKQNLEDDEIIEVQILTFQAAFEKIKIGEIQDAKTIIGLLLAANFVF